MSFNEVNDFLILGYQHILALESIYLVDGFEL